MNVNTLDSRVVSAKSPRYWLILGAALLGTVGLSAWGISQFQAARIEDAEIEASVPAITTVTALGRLEPEGEIINLAAPTSTQESRIEQLLVEEGDRVEAGQVVAILDNQALLQASLQQAEEQVRVAEAQLAQVRAGAKTGQLTAQRAEIARLEADRTTQIEAQRATVARIEAEERTARVEYERYESLYQQGAVSASERDAKELDYTSAQRRREEAQAQLTRVETTGQEQILQAESTLDQLAEVRPVDIAIAAAEVQSAMANVAEAQANLDQVSVRSPRTGQVLEIHTQPGENIAEAGILALGETDQMMAIAEVYESDVADIQLGQTAAITSSALPATLQGTVARIGLQVEQQQVVDEDPAANIDARVVEVHLRLDPADSQQVASLANLQVTVTIQTD